MSFESELKRCQYERHMTNADFAQYLGKSRTWLQCIYTNKNDTRKFGLTGLTMYVLNEKLGIPFELMEEYNKKFSKPRGGFKESDM